MHFKKPLITLLAAASVLLLSSCFNHETTIRLNKDGSGTLVEETRLSGQILEMIGQFAGGFGGDQAPQDPVKDMLSEEKAKERAAELGEGVTFQKIEPVTVGESKGARTTYAFADINKLRVSADDLKKQLPKRPQGFPGGEQPNKLAGKPIVFNYKDGVLTIVPNNEKDVEKPDEEDMAEAKQKLESPEAMAMMKQMFADLKVSIKLVAESGIAETNATYQEGDTITLMEMDMNKLMENPENFEKLGALDQNNPAAAMEALKGINGVKAEVKPEITVKLM
jgi:hypothetical protein